MFHRTHSAMGDFYHLPSFFNKASAVPIALAKVSRDLRLQLCVAPALALAPALSGPRWGRVRDGDLLVGQGQVVPLEAKQSASGHTRVVHSASSSLPAAAP